MGRPTIRVSDAAFAELRRRAAEERRTVVAIIDLALGVGPAVKPATVPKAKMVEVEPAKDVEVAGCPRCGCSRSVHWRFADEVRAASWVPVGAWAWLT